MGCLERVVVRVWLEQMLRDCGLSISSSSHPIPPAGRV